MSGEYFCIEEVDPGVYYNEYENKSALSSPTDQRMPNTSQGHGDVDVLSNDSRKSQEYRLREIEEQLEIAENRCNTLKGHLDFMKKNYNKSGKNESVPNSKRSRNEPIESTFVPKSFKKHSTSAIMPSNNQKQIPSSTNKQEFYESTDTLPQKSSSSSTAVQVNIRAVPRAKDPFSSSLVRQNSCSIGTDTTGAAVRTMNTILSGITESVNRLSQIHVAERTKKSKKMRDASCGSLEIDAMCTLREKPFSPRLEKRMSDQQKKIEEIAKSMEASITQPPSTLSWGRQKYSSSSIKSKPQNTWMKHSRTKNPIHKTKTQSLSGSGNLAKSMKSVGKGDNATKVNVSKTAGLDNESYPGLTARKRKRGIKRLRPSSKTVLARKFNEHNSAKLIEQLTTHNLVELYHNLAAKASDSDESNNNSGSKTQVTKQKGGGDLTVAHQNFVPTYEVPNEENVMSRPVTKLFNASRMLPPINENGYAQQNFLTSKTDCFGNIIKNYELPTIASKMKQVTKCYLHSFNFRSIPFCAAKSITPSHNIGINIQQVMSIIKTRQPISGISPTLAHNISLAAGKLQNRPLSTLVSALSSKLGQFSRYEHSQCPLTRNQLNYSQLQEMAKEMQEIPEEKLEDIIEVGHNEAAGTQDALVNGFVQTREDPDDTCTIWTIDPTNQKRCTCVPEKGVPFRDVLNRYQMSSETVCKPTPVTKITIPLSRRQTGVVPFNPSVRKLRTKNWIRSEANSRHVIEKVPEETLQGKERNLKSVLQNLHDEFDGLNTKYESLAKHVDHTNNKNSNDAMKELEEMESALNKKEEEINMVMSLYTEVLALKEQVKKLRERTSQGSVAVNTPLKFTEYKEPKAALHLTQLLRQIQNYQIHYKSKA